MGGQAPSLHAALRQPPIHKLPAKAGDRRWGDEVLELCLHNLPGPASAGGVPTGEGG